MILLLLPTHPVMAVRVKGLHQTTVLVVNRSSGARRIALRQVLFKVLVKVSGDPSILQVAGLQLALESPQRFVQEFFYQNHIHTRYA